DRDIRLELDDSAKELLVEQGFDPVYGARPLKRAIQTMVQNPLAAKILKGEISSGETVKVTAADGKLDFKAVKDESKAARS
ncbi:MAG TPA: hypothetical protein VNK26_05740, partial [Pyrinomonadaceae bacterium]|nr:hypothetical protein [Pyrinomonadaceae bacterium]